LDATKKILVECKSFKEALIRVSILSNDRFRGVRLNFLDNEIKVSANNQEKEEASDDIKATYSGEPIEVGFNVNYLIDVLNAIKTKNVQILLKDNNSSALLMPENDNSSSYVVMPLRI
jgi:DNA polymerase-3 subunit beta